MMNKEFSIFNCRFSIADFGFKIKCIMKNFQFSISDFRFQILRLLTPTDSLALWERASLLLDS